MKVGSRMANAMAKGLSLLQMAQLIVVIGLMDNLTDMGQRDLRMDLPTPENLLPAK